MDITYTTGGKEEKQARVKFDPPLLGYEEVKPRMIGMKADAEESLGMVSLFFLDNDYLSLHAFVCASATSSSFFVIVEFDSSHLSDPRSSNYRIQRRSKGFYLHRPLGCAPLLHHFCPWRLSFSHLDIRCTTTGDCGSPCIKDFLGHFRGLPLPRKSIYVAFVQEAQDWILDRRKSVPFSEPQ
jgi:hypothetical protein